MSPDDIQVHNLSMSPYIEIDIGNITLHDTTRLLFSSHGGNYNFPFIMAWSAENVIYKNYKEIQTMAIT